MSPEELEKFNIFKDQIKNLNYQNFIYLFNNPNEIKISRISVNPDIKRGSYFVNPGSLNQDASNNAIDFIGVEAQDVFKSDGTKGTTSPFKATVEKIKPFKDNRNTDFGDFPELYEGELPYVGLRNDETLSNHRGTTMLSIGLIIPSVPGANNPNFASIDGNYKITNDIGYSPASRHEFQESIKEGVYKHKFIRDKEDTNNNYYCYAINYTNGNLSGDTSKNIVETYYTNNPIVTNSVPTTIKVINLLTTDGWVETNKNIITVSLENTSEQKFRYEQNMYLAAREKTAGGSVIAGHDLASILTKNNGINELAQSGISRWIFNMSTKIGVPYDFRETNIANALPPGYKHLPLNSLGIKEPTPSFENLYNYYDPQYEPAAQSLINENVLNENALPSAYDIIYYNSQPKTISNIVDVLDYATPESPSPAFAINIKNVKISNLNSYLDKLSVLYRRYIDGYAVSQGDDPGFPDETAQSLDYQYLDELELYSQGIIGVNPKTGIISNTSKQQVLDKFVTFPENYLLWKTAKAKSIPKWVEQIKKAIYFSEKSMHLFDQTDQYSRVFPFAVKINIPQETRGPIGKMLSESNLLDCINTHAASLSVPYDRGDVNESSNANDNVSRIKTYANFYGGLVSDPSISNNEEEVYNGFNLYQQIKLKTFKMHFKQRPYSLNFPKAAQPNINKVFDYQLTDLFMDNISEIGMSSPKNVLIYAEKETQLMVSPLSPLLEKMKSVKFFNSLEEQFRNGLLRTPLDIQKGKLAHQETLMYEIVKYQISEQSGEEQAQHIQSVFLPVTDKSSLDYLDTQVIPQKNYFYKIFAHKVIVGTKYRVKRFDDSSPEYFVDFHEQSNIGFPPSGDGYTWSKYKHKYEVEPYLQFVRVPYYNAPLVNIKTDKLNFSRIEDFPPLPPQVKILPYKNINNKLLFLFNNSSGEEVNLYKEILDSDKASHDLVKISQNSIAPVTFKSDDIPAFYEIHRIEKEPGTYKYFSPKVTNSAISYTLDAKSQTSFVDSIMPNKDYYYTFRTIDIHGKFSNPTIVYKVNIIDGATVAPYLKIDTIELGVDTAMKARQTKLSSTKTFKKYLLFGLKDLVYKVDYPEIEEVGGDELATGNYLTTPVNVYSTSDSNSAEATLAKKYKIRITSKQTGRKIDINVTFGEPKNIINDV